MINTIPITANGKVKLKKELDYLEQVERPKIIEAIQRARELGDLSENAEYKSAKERKATIDSRIGYLGRRMPLLKVIDVSLIDQSVIRFGASITLLDLLNDKKITYKIVGVDESDPNEGFISIKSPLGNASIGKIVGDFFAVKTPNGTKEYEVLKIEYKQDID